MMVTHPSALPISWQKDFKMDVIKRYHKPLYILLASVFFMLMLFSYIPVVFAHFHLKQYMRFPGGGGTLAKAALVLVVTGVLLLAKRAQLPELTELLWTVFFSVSFVPESILFIYSKGYEYVGYPLFYALFLLILGRFSAWQTDQTEPQEALRPPLFYRNRLSALLVISLAGLVVFFISYGLRVDPALLLMGDVYGARDTFLATATPLQGYLKGPLLRVFLPLLLLTALEEKNYLAACFAFCGAVYLYLLTAVKTDLFGIILILFFWLIRKVPFKSLILLTGLNLTAALSIGQYLMTGSVSWYEFLLRRILFVPAMLNRVYLLTFQDYPLGWRAENIDRLLHGTGLPSVQRYVGEVVLQTKGVNASTGILTDAFIKGGYAALILPFSVLLLFAALLHYGRYPVAYSGIPVLFVFILNSSFLGPLLLTHGMAAFFLAALCFICPRQVRRGAPAGSNQPNGSSTLRRQTNGQNGAVNK